MNNEIKNRVTRIFEEEKEKLLIFIRRKISRTEDAEDILQDVFFNTLRGYSVTEPIENLTGWLYISARNRIIDFYRRRKQQHISLDDTEQAVTLESLVRERHLNPETFFFHRLLADTLSEAIEALPEKQQQIVILQMIEGRTFQEISEATGESINTLLSRKRYAVQRLRKVLKDIDDILHE